MTADIPAEEPAVTGTDRRTLEAIFRHPSAHNLEWMDVIRLIEAIGEVEPKGHTDFAFKVAGQRHLMHKPHTKDLTGTDVIELRHFLTQAGWSADASSQPASETAPAPPSLLIVVDHHEAKVYHVDVTSGDMTAHTIEPYDPHHFLHHLTHKDQSRERGQRSAEDHSFYERIAQAVAAGGTIVIVGHATGKSNAAHFLSEYLRAHHSETWRRIVRQVSADLSSITLPQLLEIARDSAKS